MMARQYFRKAIFGLIGLYVLDGVFRKGSVIGEKLQVYHAAKDIRMKNILNRMTVIREKFWPTFYACHSLPQLVLLLVWKSWHRKRGTFKRHLIELDDNGQVAIEEYTPLSPPLPGDAPVMCILHTITGTCYDEVELCKYAHDQGWRAFVLCRRGHFGRRLASPKFNILGCVRDTEVMVNYVSRLYQEASFIGACGLSAGSGQVVSYIGHQKEEYPVQAAVSLCPAYGIDTAFQHLHERNPLMSKYLLNGLKRFFLQENRPMLENIPGFHECMNSTNVAEFVETGVHMAGYKTYEEYLADSCPMNRYMDSKIPTLILNATDDPVCVEENIRFDITESSENYALVLTRSGSHIAYRSGMFGETSFMHRLALDFLEACRQEACK